MEQLTNEQVTAACLAHYPEWASFHQHERESFRKQMWQTLQAYESAKAAAEPTLGERTGSGCQSAWSPMYLIDIAKRTRIPAAVVPLPAADLVRRCDEIIDWQKTGILTGNALREFAQRRWPDEFDSLQIAERETAREALSYLVSIPGPVDEAGEYATFTISSVSPEGINEHQ